MDDAVWAPTTFTKNRDSLLDGDIAAAFFDAILIHADTERLLSDEHFTVDGTLLEGWASQKSFRPRDQEPPADGGGNPTVNFHGQEAVLMLLCVRALGEHQHHDSRRGGTGPQRHAPQFTVSGVMIEPRIRPDQRHRAERRADRTAEPSHAGSRPAPQRREHGHDRPLSSYGRSLKARFETFQSAASHLSEPNAQTSRGGAAMKEGRNRCRQQRRFDRLGQIRLKTGIERLSLAVTVDVGAQRCRG
jgi:hypothetical protein